MNVTRTRVFEFRNSAPDFGRHRVVSREGRARGCGWKKTALKVLNREYRDSEVYCQSHSGCTLSTNKT